MSEGPVIPAKHDAKMTPMVPSVPTAGDVCHVHVDLLPISTLEGEWCDDRGSKLTVGARVVEMETASGTDSLMSAISSAFSKRSKSYSYYYCFFFFLK